MCAHVAHYQTQCCPNKSLDVSFSTLLKAVAQGICMPPGSTAQLFCLLVKKKKKKNLNKKKENIFNGFYSENTARDSGFHSLFMHCV